MSFSVQTKTGILHNNSIMTEIEIELLWPFELQIHFDVALINFLSCSCFERLTPFSTP